MTPRENAKTDADFQPIPLHSLRTNTVTNFDIYIALPESGRDGKFVLYRDRNIPFVEETKRNLAEHGTDVLYIDASDRKAYQSYLEDNLGAILEDNEISAAEKSKAAYECAAGIVEGLLEDARSGEHVKRSKTFISSLVGYMLDDSHAFFDLMASIPFDYRTYTHSVNVAVFGIALAHKLGRYSRATINTIGSGLILHDLGKVLIDRTILNKHDAFDESEWVIMKRHPEEGAKLLRTMGQVSEEALIIVEDHHERLDGSGYPRGLKGDDIHPHARIAAIADVFDALTTQRPHRPALGSFQALEIMRNEMCHGLDPDLFRKFVLLLGDQVWHS